MPAANSQCFVIPIPAMSGKRFSFHTFRRPGGAGLALALTLAAIFAPGCRELHRANFDPLDGVGMSFSSEQELRGLDVSDAEVVELAKAKRAGLSDSACVELVRIVRAQKQPLPEGDAIAGLREAGMAESTILELARLNQLGLEAGEEQAMHLAGLSDRIILEVARRRTAGQPALAGASLADLKNAGVSEATMFTLLGRGVADDQVPGIVALKNNGWSDNQVLQRHPASH
jgi:hypothetical protein